MVEKLTWHTRSVGVGLALIAVGAAGLAGAAPVKRAAMPFQTMTMRDGERHGVVGTGCVWKQGAGRTWIVAMKDERAAVKRAGRYIMLSPAPGAKDLFPFTHDRWTGEGMTIAFRPTGRSRVLGSEVSERRASLVLTENGRTTTYSGILNCGS